MEKLPKQDKESPYEHMERVYPHLRVLLDALPDGIFFKDGDGRFVLANRALAEAMGVREPQDLLGKTDYDFCPRESADEYSEDEREIVKTGYKAIERLEPRTATGASRRSLVTRLPVMDASGKVIGIVGISRNVTERKKAEESLRRLNRELRAISRCNRILVRANDEETFIKDICDVVCEETGYRMAWVGFAENDELKSVRPVAWAGVEDGYLGSLGISWADTARGRGPAGTAVREGVVTYIKDVASDPSVALWRGSALERGFRSVVGIPLKNEYANTFGVLMIYAGEPEAFSADDIRILQELAEDLSFGIVSVRSLAERRRASEALQNERNLLRTLIDVLPHSIYAKDTELRKTMANPVDVRILGCTSETDVLGKTDFDLLPAEVAAGFLDDDRAVIQTGSPVIDREEYYLDASGQKRWLLTSKVPLRDAKGEIIGLVGVGRDITERKREGDMLHRLNRELRAITRCNQILIRADDEKTMVNDICDVICHEAGYRMAWVGYVEHDERKSVRPLAWAGVEEEYVAAVDITWADTERGRGPGGTAIREGTVAYVEDLASDPRVAFAREMALRHGYRSIIAIPLKDETGSVFGVLAIYAGEPEAFTPEERRLLQELADDLVFGIMSLRAQAERKRMEEALREAHERYRGIFENAVEGIFETTLDGKYRLANPALARICGYASPEELLASVTDLNRQFYVAPGRRADFVRWMEEHDTVREFESEIYRKDGSIIWVSENARAIRDERGALVGFEGTTLDVTARKRAEEALQSERNLLRTLIDVLPNSIYAKDLECRKTMANPADVEILGGETEAEVLGKTDFDCFSEEVASSFYADDQSVITTGTPVINREEYFFDRAGQKRWLLTSKAALRDAKGDVIGLVGVGREITERKAREAKIREQAQLLDIASDAIIVRDMRNRIRYWNKSAEKSYGWTAEEAIGRDEDELLHRNRSDEVKDALRAILENGNWVGDLHCATKTGGELLGEARWTLVRDDAGNPRSILCVSTDVTERRALQAQLLRAQRLESLGTLAGGIAHDLNNVLTPILMGLESLGPFIADPEARESLAAITRSAGRGANVVRQVLGFARGVETERGDVRLEDVITEVIGIARETFPKSIELVLRGADDLWTLTGSPTQLHQVLMNLCLNARDAMPEGGRLTISARNVQFDDAYVRTHVDAKPIPYVIVEIEDTGIGMPPELVDKIFDPFFTTKQPGKGTGLGLSTSLSIVKAHGGFINVDSEVGKGSSLRVYLPAALERPATLPPATPGESQSGNGELILLVDDEEAVRDAIRTVLERNGYRVITAADGTEAVALYVEHREEVRCMITDMMLPHMDGAATIRTVRRFNPDVRIIATSGLLSNGYVAEARGLGAEAFLTKPYTTEILLRTVRDVLEPKK